MKKIAVILILLVYGSTTVGATINMHYCMNEFVGWSLWHDDDNACDKCGMTEKKGGCCKDEQKLVRLKADHQKAVVAQYILLSTTPAIVTTSFTADFSSTQLPDYSPVSHAPPRLSKQRLYLFHCVFLV